MLAVIVELSTEVIVAADLEGLQRCVLQSCCFSCTHCIQPRHTLTGVAAV